MENDRLTPLYDVLHRYAGWLDGERMSATVRADVQALGAAIDAGHDPLPFIETLDTDLGRLPGGEVRKMLKVAALKMRRALTDDRPS